jgi:hypothetical protein
MPRAFARLSFAMLALGVSAAAQVRMKLLFSSANMPEVGLLKSLLDEAGIASEVRNEGSYPNFPGAAFQPEIWVIDEKDYGKACEIRDASQFSQSAGTPLPAFESQKTLRTNRIWAAVTGLFTLVLAAVCVVGFAHSRAAERAAAAVVFGCLGTFLIWLALVGWRAQVKKP